MKNTFYILLFTLACLFAMPVGVLANDTVVVEESIAQEVFDFSLSIEGKDVDILWENAPENATSFKIERSFDGKRFSPVYKSSFLDEESFPDDVSYIDADEVFYRFTFSLDNGDEFVSPTKSVSLSSQKHLKAEIFVNGGQVEFDFYSSARDYTTVQIFNGVGNVVAEEEIRSDKGENSHAITLYGMRSGMYFLRLEQNGKFTTTKFFVR